MPLEAPPSPAKPATPITPESSETPRPKTEPNPPRRPRDIAAASAGELRARLKAKREAEEAEDADDAEDDAPAKPKVKAEAPASTKKVEKLETRVEDLGGSVPDQKSGESDKDYELRLSKKIGELERTKKELEKAKKEGELSSTELKELKKLLEDGKANPLKILKHFGMTFDEFSRGIVEDKFKEPEAELKLPPELQKKIDRLEKADREREAKELETAANAQRDADQKVVKDFLEANADDFPLAASMPWAAAHVIAEAYKSKATNVLPALQSLEEGLAGNVMTAVKSEKAFKKMLAKDPELKKLLGKHFSSAGETEVKQVEIDGPTNLGEISSDPPARAGKMTRAERKKADLAAAVAELKAKRAAERAAEEAEDDEDD